MKKVIILAGCSYVVGYCAEFDNHVSMPNGTVFDEGLEHYRKIRFGQLIANQYGLNVIDAAKSGAGNESISKMANAALNIALKTYKPEEIVILAGWTDQSRIEIWTSDDDVAQAKVIEPGYSYYCFLNAYNYLDTVAKHRGVDIIHTLSMPIWESTMRTKWKIGNDVPNELLVEYSLNNEQKIEVGKLLKSKSFRQIAKLDKTRHPLPESHRMWANIIMEQYGNILGS